MKKTIVNRAKALLFLLFMLSFTTPMLAQDVTLDDVAKMMTDTMAVKYKLSKKQQEKALPLNRKTAEQMNDVTLKMMEDSVYRNGPFVHEMFDIFRGRDKELIKLLTKEQQPLYVKRRTEWLAEIQTMVLRDQLQLTPPQLDAVLKANKKTTEVINSQWSILKDGKASKKKKDLAQLKINDAYAARDKDMYSILDERQYRIYMNSQSLLKDEITKTLQ